MTKPSKIVLIGASTGGPGQIEKILKNVQNLDRTSIIIAQHMAKGFIDSFARHLKKYHTHVEMAETGKNIKAGYIYLCSGFTKVSKRNSQLQFQQEPSPENNYNPNINIIFNSFVPFTDDFNILSAILTGIGDDGVEGCKQLSLKNVTCLTETEQSAIVDGMPNRARKVVPNIKILDIKDIEKKIKEFCE